MKIAPIALACLLATIAASPDLVRTRAVTALTGTREPAVVLQAESVGAGASVLLPLARSANPTTSAFAIRALGRLEDPAVARDLLPFLASDDDGVSAAAATALAQSFHGLPRDASAPFLPDVARALRGVSGRTAGVMSAVAVSLGRLPYTRVEDVTSAEAFLVARLDDRSAGPVRGLDYLARVSGKIVPIGQATVEKLAQIVRRGSRSDDEDVRFAALSALVGAHAVGAAEQSVALADPSWEIRRLAATALAGDAKTLSSDEAAGIERLIHDPAGAVRLEGVRAYARLLAPTKGCGPLLDALRDRSAHVALAAIDLLGDQCLADHEATARLAAEVADLSRAATWHRAAHAIVSLAKRSPPQTSAAIGPFVTSSVWQVRMYAARAAAALKDPVLLRRLAGDANDNVADAALAPLVKLDADEGVKAATAALGRRDYQLIRTAALGLLDQPVRADLAAPLLASLRRVTGERRETSRDARLPLLDAIGRHADQRDGEALRPFLHDFDPAVAARAAAILTARSTARVEPAPSAALTSPYPATRVLGSCVTIRLAGGTPIRASMLRDDAPLAVARFLDLALTKHYYDNLTFHRVVPNFVIQGGSPGANEYSGAGAFMRDEIATARNLRGTIGLSTRGRDTGDAQIFVNLVNNARLDFEFTVFGRIQDEDMPAVDRILEGDRIERVTAGCR